MKIKLLLLLSLVIYGNGNAQNIFEDHILADDSNTIHRPTTILSADLDGDGNMDIVATSYTDQEIVWFKNDGDGKFDYKQLITNHLTNEQAAFAKDMDGDGDIDILCAIHGVHNDKVVWYENDGQGGFESSHFIASSIDGVNSIYTADMDGDGDPDVIVSSNYDNALAWVENT